jgi:hypothetical protein
MSIWVFWASDAKKIILGVQDAKYIEIYGKKNKIIMVRGFSVTSSIYSLFAIVYK